MPTAPEYCRFVGYRSHLEGMSGLLTVQLPLMSTSTASPFSTAKAIVDEKVESRVDDGQEMIDGDQYVAPLQRIDTPYHYSWTLESIWLARQSIKILTD